MAVFIGEFPTCLGVYEYIPNNFSQSVSQPPYFDLSMERNVSSFVSQATHLHCTVHHLGDKTVSWIRKSDLHVLTSGSHTFTGDLRFSSRHSQATHQAGVDSWILQIKPTQLKDSGEYQCQVNTEPKISFSVFLRVREARARIEGPDNKEVHVKQRSRVKLTCVVDLGRGGESAAVFWYLDGQSLDWLGQTGPGRGVQVTEKRGTQLVSTLSIERADMHHAGKFTCSPSYAKPDTVTLHVIDSESRAELQGNDNNSAASSAQATFLFDIGQWWNSQFLCLLIPVAWLTRDAFLNSPLTVA